MTGTTLKAHQVEGLARSAAMAPLSAEQVTELLASHYQLAKDWAEVDALLHRLAPAWAELRKAQRAEPGGGRQEVGPQLGAARTMRGSPRTSRSPHDQKSAVAVRPSP